MVIQLSTGSSIIDIVKMVEKTNLSRGGYEHYTSIITNCIFHIFSFFFMRNDKNWLDSPDQIIVYNPLVYLSNFLAFDEKD